ncbi:hypothetical protein [Singulisphaera sp. PoT]|uniref:hypothetical protein n=1 Tax=Singulisphaera sp. PoT TaxID=3411797 RepID=UPI003BF5AF76
MKLNILAFPYRDWYFHTQFGSAVRDLQIIDALLECGAVKKITLVNRPVSIYERLTTKRNPPHTTNPKLVVLDATSYDLMGPLRGRKWFENCYYKYSHLNLYDTECVNLILDFLPIGGMTYEAIRHDLVWYDCIDNFTKHNRFDTLERDLVRKKYRYVDSAAKLITGVSPGVVAEFERAVVVPNAAGYKPRINEIAVANDDAFDFGYIGFLTDKFDLDLIELLARNGYRISVFGKSFDSKITNRIRNLPNVQYNGAFNHSDIPRIVKTFYVGLLPYHQCKSHDESPLKLYQYLIHGKPTLTSINYELQGEGIACYDGTSQRGILELAKRLRDCANSLNFRQRMVQSLQPDHFWETKLSQILARIRTLNV